MHCRHSGPVSDHTTARRLYHEQLQTSRGHLDSLLADTDTNLQLLSTLSSSFNAVEKQAAAFQERCESLLAEQRRLSTLADDVGHNLQYYNFLDPITRRLNAPGVRHFVRGEDFLDMLSQLDDCLDYMRAHVGNEYTSSWKITDGCCSQHIERRRLTPRVIVCF